MLFVMKILKMYLKINYCEVNKERNIHIAKGTYNTCKSPNRGQNIQQLPLFRLSRSRNMVINKCHQTYL
jgi:hypothetical protein